MLLRMVYHGLGAWDAEEMANLLGDLAATSSSFVDVAAMSSVGLLAA